MMKSILIEAIVILGLLFINYFFKFFDIINHKLYIRLLGLDIWECVCVKMGMIGYIGLFLLLCCAVVDIC